MTPLPILRAIKHALVFAACLLMLGGAGAYAQANLGAITSNINIEGLETQYDPATGIATAKGDVHINYQGTDIRAGQADYNANTGDVVARQNVTVVKEGQIFYGENIIYNVKTQELKANSIRSSLPPIFYTADSFSTNTGKIEKIEGTNAFFTTHDAQNPNYRLRARKLTIYPNDRIIMSDVKAYIGDTPVFWFPYIVQPLDDELGYYFHVGYTSQWGAFLLNQYGMMIGDHTLAKYHLDLRSERGVAVGADFYSMKWKERHNDNIGALRLYYAYDSDPLTGVGGSERASEGVDSNRYRITFQHRIYIPGPDESTWYLDFDMTKLSDEFMLEDYFLNEFRSEPQPDNNIKLVKHSDYYTGTLMARFQLNNFFHTDTRLPELAFDFTRSRIGHTGLFYQGETSIGAYRDRLSESERATLEDNIKQQQTFLSAFGTNGGKGTIATTDAQGNPILGANGKPLSSTPTALAGTTLVANDPDILRATPRQLLTRDDVEKDIEALKAELNEDKFNRLYSYHEVLYPMSFGTGNWVTFVPRIGGGAAIYNSASGGLSDSSSDTKGIFHVGFDLSAKFSNTWDNVQNRTIGIDGLRHIVQPYINYSYLNAEQQDGFPEVDRLTPSTRPRPIDVPLFTATDDLRSWNIARLGVRNLLQTKRDNVTWNYAGLNSYIDVFFEDPEFNRKLSNFYNDIFWFPVPWLSLSIDSQLPIVSDDFNFTEVNTNITWMPNKRFSWTFGHQLRTDNPLFTNSSLITSRIYTKINENWGFSMNHIYEMEDSTLEYQSYSIHRDLASWTMALGGLIRDNRGSNEYGIVLSLTLKDFPSVSIPLDLDPNPTGRGGRE